MSAISPKSGLGYLSVIALADPEPISKMVLVVALGFAAAWGTVSNWFGIGSGRREADAIVPLQNTIGNRLAEIVDEYPTADLPTLERLYAELNAMAQEFTRFVSDPRFTDGRASKQALADIIPLILDNLQKIWNRIRAITPQNVPPIPQVVVVPDPPAYYPDTTYSPWIYQANVVGPTGKTDYSWLLGGLLLLLALKKKKR